jgi:ParB family chromosome partitioning protein
MSLKDKARRIDFANMPVASDAPNKGPKTAPGAMMAFAGAAKSDLLNENEELRRRAQLADALQGKLDEALVDLKSWEGAKATRLLDPKRVKQSRYANRHSSSFRDAEFAELKEEIAGAGGNVQPIKVRAISGDSEGPLYEIVFGHRRHAVCLELDLLVLAMIDNIDDRALFVEMERENRLRKDLSPWEQGMMYRKALDDGLYSSNRQLAGAVKADLGNVGRALALASLPSEVVDAFESPQVLQYRWAKPLSDALATDEDGVKARARNLAAMVPKMRAADAFNHLIAKATPEPQKVVLEVRGKVAATVILGTNGAVSVAIEAGAISPSRTDSFVKALEGFLSSEG